jgi:hypothetical protein
MHTRRTVWLIAFALVVMLLLACDIASLTGLTRSDRPSTGGTVPTAISPGIGQSSQSPEHLKCDPQKLAFPLLPDARNCQHLDIITNFQTNLSPNDAIITYNELLAKEGWKRKDDGALPGMGAWVKGTQQLNIVAAIDKGATVVQIQEVGTAAAAPTSVPRGTTPAPTSGVRATAPPPTNSARAATPLPTSRIYVAPQDITIKPEPVQGDFVWTGMGTKGEVINFCVYRNWVHRMHYVGPVVCQDKQTRQTYTVSYNLGSDDLPSFVIYPNGRFNLNGEYTIPDGVYKDVTFGIIGVLGSSQGRVWVSITSENQVVRCEQGALGEGRIDIKRLNVPCSP